LYSYLVKHFININILYSLQITIDVPRIATDYIEKYQVNTTFLKLFKCSKPACKWTD